MFFVVRLLFISLPRRQQLLQQQQQHYRRHYHNHRHHYLKGIAAMADTILPSSIPAQSLIDKAQFTKQIKLVGVQVPAQSCNQIMNEFKQFLFNHRRMKRIYDVEANNDVKIVLLSQEYSDLSLATVPPPFKTYLDSIQAQALEFPLLFSYDTLSADEILTSLLPAGCEVPSSFEQVGHIAHLNLRDEMLPYKQIIGQVLLDKNPAIKTVVNKVGSIETEFRTFPMEVLAGVADFDVTVRESDARFAFNFAEVYWNSRLQMEHSRLINAIKASAPDQLMSNSQYMQRGLIGKSCVTVADMMAGVGPFAVPLAMSGKVTVYANDLNPSSHKYLVSNAKLNKCETFLKPFNLDGREFILHLASQNIPLHHAIMNLPASATDFLDVFIGYSQRYTLENSNDSLAMPMIHVYGFSTDPQPFKDMIERAASKLQCSPDLILVENKEGDSKSSKEDSGTTSSTSSDRKRKHKDVSNATISSTGLAHIVRDVAPNKVMVCLSFRLPVEVANANPVVFKK